MRKDGFLRKPVKNNAKLKSEECKKEKYFSKKHLKLLTKEKKYGKIVFGQERTVLFSAIRSPKS